MTISGLNTETTYVFIALFRVSWLRVSTDPQVLNEQKKRKTFDRIVVRIGRERKGIVLSIATKMVSAPRDLVRAIHQGVCRCLPILMYTAKRGCGTISVAIESDSRLQLRWFPVPALRYTLAWSKTHADYPKVYRGFGRGNHLSCNQEYEAQLGRGKNWQKLASK